MARRFFAVLLLLITAFGTPALAEKTSLVVGMAIEPSGLDPTIAAPAAIREVTWVNLFEGLVRIDRDGKIQPLLAKSWDISEDGLSYTFRLNTPVKFHDGRDFTSNDVKFSFDRARGPSSTNAQKQIFTPIESIGTPDPTTVVIKLKEPSGNFLYHLGWGDAVIVSAQTADRNQTNPVGTGPFKFKSWARGDRVELVRNSDYWGAAKPRLETVTFRFINDPQAQVAAVRAGDVDAFPNLGAPELFADLKQDPRFTAIAGNTEGEVVAGLNSARKPFTDVRVRQALMHAIDRQAIVDGAYSGFGRPIGSHFSPNHPAFVDETGAIPYDPEKAKALLREAGYGNGLAISVKTPQMAYASRSAELIAAMLAQVGVTLSIVPTEFPAKWIEDVFKNKDYDVTIVAHTEPLDIDIYGRDNYYFNFKSEKLKAILDKAARSTLEADRFGAYREAQDLLAREVPALFLFQLPKLGVWNAKLKGMWENSPIPSNDVTDVFWVD